MPDIELLHAEYNKRRQNRFKAFTRISFSIIAIFFLTFLGFTTRSIDLELGDNTDEVQASSLHKIIRNNNHLSFVTQLGFIKDTVYTSMPSYLEINLDSQKVYHHWKDGKIFEYKISTGSPYLQRGIETKQGVFVVQQKIDWLYSLQFDSTKVFNWLGFNYGIGFHSLQSKRYYRHLGKRPSSHGCVRMSQEDAEHLYKTVQIGTPVIVHKSNHARVLEFIKDDSPIDTTSYSRSEASNIFHQRLRSLYQGKKFFYDYPLIPLSTKCITHSGLEIGDEHRIPLRQRIPMYSENFICTRTEYTYVTIRQFAPWHEQLPKKDKTEIEKEILP